MESIDLASPRQIAFNGISEQLADGLPHSNDTSSMVQSPISARVSPSNLHLTSGLGEVIRVEGENKLTPLAAAATIDNVTQESSVTETPSPIVVLPSNRRLPLLHRRSLDDKKSTSNDKSCRPAAKVLIQPKSSGGLVLKSEELEKNSNALDGRGGSSQGCVSEKCLSTGQDANDAATEQDGMSSSSADGPDGQLVGNGNFVGVRPRRDTDLLLEQLEKRSMVVEQLLQQGETLLSCDTLQEEPDSHRFIDSPEVAAQDRVGDRDRPFTLSDSRDRLATRFSSDASWNRLTASADNVMASLTSRVSMWPPPASSSSSSTGCTPRLSKETRGYFIPQQANDSLLSAPSSISRASSKEASCHVLQQANESLFSIDSGTYLPKGSAASSTSLSKETPYYLGSPAKVTWSTKLLDRSVERGVGLCDEAQSFRKKVQSEPKVLERKIAEPDKIGCFMRYDEMIATVEALSALRCSLLAIAEARFRHRKGPSPAMLLLLREEVESLKRELQRLEEDKADVMLEFRTLQRRLQRAEVETNVDQVDRLTGRRWVDLNLTTDELTELSFGSRAS